jgi:adenylate cyclase
LGVVGYLAWSAEQIRRTFGRYLSDAIVARLLEQPEGLALGGERRRLTLLTSDLRGFTSLSESLLPERVIAVVNAYLKQMAEVITEYGGTIDEFMGDGILVLFGAPTALPDDAQRAIACAIAMQRAMAGVNAGLRAQGLPGLEMGIGVHTGEVVVGNIGSERRTKYGVLGAQVNLTYRLESYTLGGQVLMSEACYEAAGGGSLIQVGDRRQVFPKGVRSGLWIYEVLAVGAPFELALPLRSECWVRLREPLTIAVVLLDDKDASQPRRSAQIVALSEWGAQVESEFGLSEFVLFSTVKLSWGGAIGADELEAYAKVVDRRDEPGCCLRFTARSAEALADCDRWRNRSMNQEGV